MNIRDFVLLVLICLAWAFSTVLSKVVISELNAPPLFYAAARFTVVALVCAPWLFPAPKPLWRVMVVGLCMGAGSFALVFIGLETATPSATAIVSQLGVPITTILSVIVLGEVIGWRRRLGILLAFTGTMLVMWDPRGVSASTGLAFVAAAAVCSSVGAIMMRQMSKVRPLQFQAWVGLVSAVPLALGTLLLEEQVLPRAINGGWMLFFAVMFAALVVSVCAHTTYYGLIKKYEASLIAPLTLMCPLFTIALGMAMTGDRLTVGTVLGSSIALGGVLLIAVRRNSKLPISRTAAATR
ncbi:DMT family transporter [Camelimonas lactis]|uniref:Putative membrane protein n=1 Tax=Camelimonas lactis TaxID=659006 RepID=A0A4R2GZD8_9HYPH|nr:DMT family transporter [Camelimonas lactis]TCO16056.1 putative membrane protein [Camelimonas lactis]